MKTSLKRYKKKKGGTYRYKTVDSILFGLSSIINEYFREAFEDKTYGNIENLSNVIDRILEKFNYHINTNGTFDLIDFSLFDKITDEILHNILYIYEDPNNNDLEQAIAMYISNYINIMFIHSLNRELIEKGHEKLIYEYYCDKSIKRKNNFTYMQSGHDISKKYDIKDCIELRLYEGYYSITLQDITNSFFDYLLQNYSITKEADEIDIRLPNKIPVRTSESSEYQKYDYRPIRVQKLEPSIPIEEIKETCLVEKEEIRKLQEELIKKESLITYQTDAIRLLKEGFGETKSNLLEIFSNHIGSNGNGNGNGSDINMKEKEADKKIKELEEIIKRLEEIFENKSIKDDKSRIEIESLKSQLSDINIQKEQCFKSLNEQQIKIEKISELLASLDLGDNDIGNLEITINELKNEIKKFKKENNTYLKQNEDDKAKIKSLENQIKELEDAVNKATSFIQRNIEKYEEIIEKIKSLSMMITNQRSSNDEQQSILKELIKEVADSLKEIGKFQEENNLKKEKELVELKSKYEKLLIDLKNEREKTRELEQKLNDITRLINSIEQNTDSIEGKINQANLDISSISELKNQLKVEKDNIKKLKEEIKNLEKFNESILTKYGIKTRTNREYKLIINQLEKKVKTLEESNKEYTRLLKIEQEKNRKLEESLSDYENIKTEIGNLSRILTSLEKTSSFTENTINTINNKIIEILKGIEEFKNKYKEEKEAELKELQEELAKLLKDNKYKDIKIKYLNEQLKSFEGDDFYEEANKRYLEDIKTKKNKEVTDLIAKLNLLLEKCNLLLEKIKEPTVINIEINIIKQQETFKRQDIEGITKKLSEIQNLIDNLQTLLKKIENLKDSFDISLDEIEESYSNYYEQYIKIINYVENIRESYNIYFEKKFGGNNKRKIKIIKKLKKYKIH